MDVSFIGYEESLITFKASGTIQKGNLVKVSGNGEVSTCVANDVFCGIAVDVRNGYVSVKMKGYAEVAYVGTAPGLGYIKLAAGSGSEVKAVTQSTDSSEAAAEGRTILVVNKDTTNSKIVIIL